MWKWCQILFPWSPKSMWMVTAAKKLEDSFSLEEQFYITDPVHADNCLIFHTVHNVS